MRCCCELARHFLRLHNPVSPFVCVHHPIHRNVKKKSLVLLTLSVFYLLYSGWVYTSGTQSTDTSVFPNHAAQQGKLVYQKYNCTACHQIFGLGGYLGPELTTTMSQPGKGEILAEAFLKNGTAKMPNLHLQETEIADLIQYLKYVDEVARSGKYPGSPVALKQD